MTATYGSDATAVTGYVRNIHRHRHGTPASTASNASQLSWNSVGDDGGAGTQNSTSRSYFTAPPVTSPPSTFTTTKTTAPTARQRRDHDQGAGRDHDQGAHRDHDQGAHRDHDQEPTATTTKAPATTTTLTGTVKATIPAKPLAGFDACTAPSQAAMKAWKAKYSAIGIYIGGQNMACDYGNLSAAWVKAVHAMGWSLLPIYVGLQAPCNSFQKISTKTPATQGTQAADTAIGDAASFGLGKGSPIYFDMESYNNANASCKSTVLQFLDAWTKEIHAKGYVSGVYSSASTGITDLATTTTISGHALNQPDALWFALWDKKNNLTGTPYLASTKWAADRVKQYQGNQNVKVGSYTLNIDADWVGGAVSGP